MTPIYDKFAKVYDRAFQPFEKWFLSRWRKETLDFLPKNAAMLELGAGTGANFEFYPNTKLAISSEISLKMLEIAKTKKKSNRLIQADAQNLPFSENVFDAAFATLVFCSIPEPEIAFAELKRVIKPGGSIILLEHVRPPGALGYLFDLLNLLTVALIDDHFNRRTAEMAKKSGLKIIEIREKAAGAVNLIVCEVVK
ncbi:MAG: class I SAM-dependent methyltransferase [Acidobacteriota bacterium]|nr:class I SAM-dependent methyltransferase [Acidobacteriota bacterium]